MSQQNKNRNPRPRIPRNVLQVQLAKTLVGIIHNGHTNVGVQVARDQDLRDRFESDYFIVDGKVCVRIDRDAITDLEKEGQHESHVLSLKENGDTVRVKVMLLGENTETAFPDTCIASIKGFLAHGDYLGRVIAHFLDNSEVVLDMLSTVKRTPPSRKPLSSAKRMVEALDKANSESRKNPSTTGERESKPTKKAETGILRPMESKPKKSGQPNGKSGNNHGKPKAKPAPQAPVQNAPTSEPREKPAGLMGTFSDVPGSQLKATGEVLKQQKESKHITTEVSRTSTGTRMFEGVDQAPNKVRAEDKETPTVEAPKPTPEDRIADAEAVKAEVAEEVPTIRAKQVRMYISALQKNGGDLDALPVSDTNLKVIRKAAIEAGVSIKEEVQIAR